MADLIVIGCPDDSTAEMAAAEVGRLGADLVIEPEAVAITNETRTAGFDVTTTHHEVSGGAVWGM